MTDSPAPPTSHAAPIVAVLVQMRALLQKSAKREKGGLVLLDRKTFAAVLGLFETAGEAALAADELELRIVAALGHLRAGDAAEAERALATPLERPAVVRDVRAAAVHRLLRQTLEEAQALGLELAVVLAMEGDGGGSSLALNGHPELVAFLRRKLEAPAPGRTPGGLILPGQ